MTRKFHHHEEQDKKDEIVKKQAKGTQQEPRPAPKMETTSEQVKSSFPIVGIGASAGGLEALEQFLSHVPA
jgi:two-component system CheB/CheR fusion protein